MPVRRRDALESLEDPILIVARNAFARVPHVEAGLGTVGVEHDLNGTSASEFDRVREQVGDHLAEADAVPVPHHLVVQSEQER